MKPTGKEGSALPSTSPTELLFKASVRINGKHLTGINKEEVFASYVGGTPRFGDSLHGEGNAWVEALEAL